MKITMLGKNVYRKNEDEEESEEIQKERARDFMIDLKIDEMRGK